MNWRGLTVALAMCAVPASAQVPQVFETSTDSFGESPKTGMLELKLGSYAPRLRHDVVASPETLYKDLFGSNMVLFELEYDWQFFQRFGSLGLGLSAGYGEKWAPTRTLVLNAAGEVDLSLSPELAEKTNLKVFPLKLLLVYRLDYAANRWRIPVVPYGKAGVVFIPWSMGKGSVRIDTNDAGQGGSGGSLGHQFTGGLALQLDFLEPRLAREFDTDMGVNHSYLFAEYNYIRANTFGTKLDLSSQYFAFGLGLEF